MAQFGQILGHVPLAVAPGEVGVGLGEAHLGQAVHHLGAGKRLGQEDHVRLIGMNVGDQPLPKRERLRVRIIHAENAHALHYPEVHDVAQRPP